MLARIVLALLLILPIAPLLDRVVFRPIADATVLLLLIVAVALHFALVGLGLLFFGPEGVRTQPFSDGSIESGRHPGLGTDPAHLVERPSSSADCCICSSSTRSPARRCVRRR